MAAAVEQLSRARDRRPDPDDLLETLYDAYRGDVQRVALRFVRNREDAEDVTQTTFLNAYRALARGKRPESPRAWLLAIAQHVCCRRFQSRKRRPSEVCLDPDLVGAGADDSTPTAEDICSALQQLGPRERSALFMREFKGYTYADIAARLGLSLSAVESLLFRARRSLREQLELADVTPCTAPVESRRRSLSGVLPWPAGFAKLLGWLGFSPARGGLSASVAAGIGAAVIAAGVAVERGAPPGAHAAPVMPLRQQPDVREPAYARVAFLDEPVNLPMLTPTRESVAERPAAPRAERPEHATRLDPEASRSATSTPEPGAPSLPSAPSLPQPPPVTAPSVPAPEPPPVSIPEVEAPPLPSLPELPPVALPDVPPSSLPALP